MYRVSVSIELKISWRHIKTLVLDNSMHTSRCQLHLPTFCSLYLIGMLPIRKSMHANSATRQQLFYALLHLNMYILPVSSIDPIVWILNCRRLILHFYLVIKRNSWMICHFRLIFFFTVVTDFNVGRENCVDPGVGLGRFMMLHI